MAERNAPPLIARLGIEDENLEFSRLNFTSNRSVNKLERKAGSAWGKVMIGLGEAWSKCGFGGRSRLFEVEIYDPKA